MPQGCAACGGHPRQWACSCEWLLQRRCALVRTAAPEALHARANGCSRGAARFGRIMQRVWIGAASGLLAIAPSPHVPHTHPAPLPRSVSAASPGCAAGRTACRERRQHPRRSTRPASCCPLTWRCT
eukprot:296913-Chlamydomonas_euryale.AAC.11